MFYIHTRIFWGIVKYVYRKLSRQLTFQLIMFYDGPAIKTKNRSFGEKIFSPKIRFAIFFCIAKLEFFSSKLTLIGK